MNCIPTAIPDVFLIEPTVFGDDRGFFFESFNAQQFQDQTGVTETFVQDNHSRSNQFVLRGLHYQMEQPQGKLIRTLVGSIFDVAVDLRQSSPTFGKWVGYELSAENKRQLWIPGGFAHGFLVRSPVAEVAYKTTAFYAPQHERSVKWDDPDLGIDWELAPGTADQLILSSKDLQAVSFKAAEYYA